MSQQASDAASFAGDLEVHARELLVVQTLGDVPGELSLTPEADAALLAQAERVPAAVVVALLEAVGGAMEAVRAGADARTRLELALVKAAKPEVDASMRALLSRIERLEDGGAAPAAAAPAEAPPTPQAESPTDAGPTSQADSPPETGPASQAEAAVEVTVAAIATAPARAETQLAGAPASAAGGDAVTPTAQAIADDLAPLLS
ncbi:MAG: polymerase subunit gamma/tau, partial [Solirubrobacteraceae bacterium]|nr:polymerase subunit gamma/tau [Solirubrobacteraceae bacterium]